MKTTRFPLNTLISHRRSIGRNDFKRVNVFEQAQLRSDSDSPSAQTAGRHESKGWTKTTVSLTGTRTVQNRTWPSTDCRASSHSLLTRPRVRERTQLRVSHTLNNCHMRHDVLISKRTRATTAPDRDQGNSAKK